MKIIVEGKTLSMLTSAEEEKLRNLAILARKDPVLGTEATVKTIIEHLQRFPNSTTMITFLICSSCKEDVVRVRKTWPLHLFRGRQVGYFCENPACDYYLKFVPAEKGYELLSFRHMPKIKPVSKAGGTNT